MSIESLCDLTSLNSRELYSVYMGIAEADHHWRARAMYGADTPPPGHNVFRPLSFEQFAARIDSVRGLAGGETMLRQRLARQAAAYQVDVGSTITERRQAA